ncbi:MAG: DUF1844 domain-containing protein [Planctomycetota bacterium]
MPDDPPQIQIDDDWKAQARAEKQRLSGAADAGSSAGDESATASDPAGRGSPGSPPGSAPGGIPPASFETLISTIATQAIMAMGGMADPRTGEPMLDLELARHHIDTLGVLETKTAGNLGDDERDLLGSALYELRSRYVQLGQASRPSAG